MRANGERSGAGASPEPKPASGSPAEQPALSWVLASLSRHRWTAITVWLVLTVAAAFWIREQPSLYVAEALVMVESHRVPAQWVPMPEDPDLEWRLECARQKLLGSRELRAVMRRLDLFAERRRAGASEHSLVAEMQSSLVIAPLAPSRGGRVGPYRVAYQAPEADTAVHVANHVATRFIELAAEAFRVDSGALASFLASQALSTQQELEQREAALLEFRVRHFNELPEQVEFLRAIAQRLRAELTDLRIEAQSLEREKKLIEHAERAGRTELAWAAKPVSEAPDDRVSNGSSPRGGPYSETLKQRLAALLAVYTPEHPDVQRLLAEAVRAERLEAEAASRTSVGPQPDPGTSRPSPPPDPTGGVSARLSQIVARLETIEARRTRLAAELGAAEARLHRVPLRQQELAPLERDQAFLNEQFRNLAARQRHAEMADALERTYPSERLSILEQALLPEKPIGPWRGWLLILASLGGLIVGGLLALVRSVEVPAWSQPARVVPAHGREDRPSYITA